MRILLDTNAYSHMMRNEQQVATIVRNATEIVMPAVVIAELLSGFRTGNQFARHYAELQSFLEHPRTVFVPADYETADRYSRIASTLRAKGRPIPTNDIWIAAHTMQTGVELVSDDQHFSAVDGIAWLQVPHS